jgi:hypothetical protein
LVLRRPSRSVQAKEFWSEHRVIPRNLPQRPNVSAVDRKHAFRGFNLGAGQSIQAQDCPSEPARLFQGERFVGSWVFLLLAHQARFAATILDESNGFKLRQLLL